MKKTYVIKSIIVMIIFILFSSINVHSFSDQTTTERILKENKHFVEFLNVCLTNFADKKKEEFSKAFSKHFNADVAYLQSDYKRAYKRIYSSQEDMEKLYRGMLKDYYLEDSKAILDRFAPGIIRSKNSRARLYLTLGYRDRTVSWTHFIIADSSNPKLFSYKLYKYEEAIKMARRAKRYGFLALFESQSNENKKKVYNHMCKSENKSGSPFMNRFLDMNENDYIKELVKSYEEYQKDLKSGKETGGEKVPDKTADETKSETVNKPVKRVFENNVERRVRFRNEKRTAKYLLIAEFDRAEDIMRKYIDDFNFKLIESTFQVLSVKGGGGSTEEPKEGQGAGAGDKGYTKYKVHLMDNYLRLTKNSIMDNILETVKVEE